MIVAEVAHAVAARTGAHIAIVTEIVTVIETAIETVTVTGIGIAIGIVGIEEREAPLGVAKGETAAEADDVAAVLEMSSCLFNTIVIIPIYFKRISDTM